MVSQIALCTLFLSAGFLTNAGDAELRWNEHYGAAKEAAQSGQRPMVIVLENPEDSKQQLDVELTKEDRERLKNDGFELCRVDTSTDYGKRVAAAFGAKQFPYTAVTDVKSQHIVFRKAGQMSSGDWTMALAKSSQTYTSPIQSDVAHTAQKVVFSDVAYEGQVITQPAQSVPAYQPVYTDFGTSYGSPYIAPQSYYTPSYCPSCQRR